MSYLKLPCEADGPASLEEILRVGETFGHATRAIQYHVKMGDVLEEKLFEIVPGEGALDRLRLIYKGRQRNKCRYYEPNGYVSTQ
jgi:hypothetical protein